MNESRAPDLSAAAYWKAVATLPMDRRQALADIERFFVAGSVPEGLDGFHRGRLVATTLGYGLDFLPETLARLWMPWKGKTFDAASAEGRNVFSTRGRLVARLLWPRYRGIAHLTRGWTPPSGS
jgi:hypothetical protein